jgi:3-oxoacyl-[acyl-carrier-protein] synthase III
MDIILFEGIKVSGISAAVPEIVVDNMIAHPHMSREEKEKTIKLTGVREFRKAGPDVCTSDLCKKAAEALFKEMFIQPESIDCILFISQTPDYRLPSTACLLQDKLSCSKDILAFDINLGCSGYVYGLYTAYSFIQGGGMKRVLLLCGDTQTKLYHPEDRNVSMILGDAGTATIIEKDEQAYPVTMKFMTDGSRYDKLIIPAGGCRRPSTSDTREIKSQIDGGIRSDEQLYMDGMEIFNFSVTDVIKTIQAYMEVNGLSSEEIDYLFLHQANKFMTDKIARKLKFPLEKVPYSLDVYGNTAGASIPLTIVYNFSKQRSLVKKRCFLSGFGVGLSWGLVDIVLDNVICPPLQEIS